jgi:hypothetical protein
MQLLTEGAVPQMTRPEGDLTVGGLVGSDDLDKKKESRPSWRAPLAVGLVLLLILAVIATSALLARPGFTSRATHSPEVTKALPPVPGSRWGVRASLPEARSGLAAAVYDGMIYAIGGQTGTGVTGAVTRYIPATNVWQTLSPLPEPVTDIQAVVVGEKIYVPGGQTAAGAQTDLLEVYDPRRDIWEQKMHLPVAVSGYALAAFEGRLYLFGGQSGSKILGDVYEYDPAQDTWQTRSPLTSGRAFCRAAVVGEKIYLVGGFDGQVALDLNEIYFPGRDAHGETAWSPGPSLPSGRYAMGVASLIDRIYLVGGKVSTSEETELFGSTVTLQYLPANGQWLTFDLPLNPVGRGMGMVALENQLYVIGGNVSTGPLDGNQAYKAIYTFAIPIVVK